MKTFTVWPRGARPPTLKSLFTFRSSSFAGAAVDGAELLELREALLLRAPRLGDLGLDVRGDAADDGRDGRLRAGVLLVGVGRGGAPAPAHLHRPRLPEAAGLRQADRERVLVPW